MVELDLPVNPENNESQRGLKELMDAYFPEEWEFVEGLHFEEALGYVYGVLLELGEDPDEVLNEFGIILPTGEEENE